MPLERVELLLDDALLLLQLLQLVLERRLLVLLLLVLLLVLHVERLEFLLLLVNLRVHLLQLLLRQLLLLLLLQVQHLPLHLLRILAGHALVRLSREALLRMPGRLPRLRLSHLLRLLALSLNLERLLLLVVRPRVAAVGIGDRQWFARLLAEVVGGGHNLSRRATSRGGA